MNFTNTPPFSSLRPEQGLKIYNYNSIRLQSVCVVVVKKPEFCTKLNNNHFFDVNL